MPASEEKAHICCCIHLRGAARAVTALYDAALESSGLRITQFATLGALQRLGPTCLNSLAEAMRLDRTTLVRNLELLKKQGLVDEVCCSTKNCRDVEEGHKGRKARLVRITALGEAKRREIEPLRDQARARLDAVLNPEEHVALEAILDKLLALHP